MAERQEEQRKTIVIKEFATEKNVIIYEFVTFLNCR